MVPQVLATIQATTDRPAPGPRDRPVRRDRRHRRGRRPGARRRAGRRRHRRHAAGGRSSWSTCRSGSRRWSLAPGLGAGDPLAAPRAGRPARHRAARRRAARLLVPLTEGRALGWPLWSWAAAGRRARSLAPAFVAVERRAERAGPVRRWCRRRSSGYRACAAGLVLAVPFFVGFGGFMFVYALLVQGALAGARRCAGSRSRRWRDVLRRVAAHAAAGRRWGRSVVTAGAALQVVGLVGLGLTVRGGLAATSASLELLPGSRSPGSVRGWSMPSLIRIVLSDVPRGLGGCRQRRAHDDPAGLARRRRRRLGSLFLALAGPDGDGHARRPADDPRCPVARRRHRRRQPRPPGSLLTPAPRR